MRASASALHETPAGRVGELYMDTRTCVDRIYAVGPKVDPVPRLAWCPGLRDQKLRAEVMRSARTYRAGETITSEGGNTAPLLFILDGWVASWKMLWDGRRQIIDVALPLDVLTPLSACGKRAWCGLDALTISVVAAPSMPLVSLEVPAPLLSQGLGPSIAAARARQAERILRIGQGSAYERVGYVLLELFVRLSAIGRANGNRFRVSMTQQRIGEYIGLSSVHVCRVLSRLCADGIISHRDEEIEVLELDALAEIADVNLGHFRERILPAATN